MNQTWCFMHYFLPGPKGDVKNDCKARNFEHPPNGPAQFLHLNVDYYYCINVTKFAKSTTLCYNILSPFNSQHMWVEVFQSIPVFKGQAIFKS